MNDGQRLIVELKHHTVELMSADPACRPEATGLGNVEIERPCGLALHLVSQDHYLTYSLLCSLLKDGIIERVVTAKSPRRPKYGLPATPSVKIERVEGALRGA